VQVREQHEPFPKTRVLALDRLLHLQQQLRLRPNVVDGDDACARAFVIGVGERAALTRRGLDEHVMSVLRQLACTRGRQRDAVLVGLDLFGDADAHDARTLACRPMAQEKE